jgi:hypothetical protein
MRDGLPITLTSTPTMDTATPAVSRITPQLTQMVATQTIEPEMEPVVKAAREFFDLVRQGDFEGALSYWDLHEDDARNFERIARDWHAQGLQFSIGEVKYSGFVAAGDFQDLEKGDARITTASVEVAIGDQPYYLMFAKVDGGWRMNGLLVRESE